MLHQDSFFGGLRACVFLLAIPFALTPVRAETSDDTTAFPGLKIAGGFRAALYADDTQVGNAVAICFDFEGRLYAAEAHRRMTGVQGVTSSRWWSMEDYRGESLADREAMYERWAHVVPPAKLTRHSDIVRRLSDRDGDGRADQSGVFADGFDGPLEGNAAGITTRDGAVYLANVPSLWRLEDSDGDGVAAKSEREEMLTGFGVRVGVFGHDLHGLTWGPDGRLYFTLGDRGFNLVNREGERLFAPARGAVFRCFRDGRGLEVFHLGLRNPQDLAFNETGDLFTVDNDMGGEDKSRVVHVVEGGDSGWDAAFQLTRNFREETGRHDHPEPPWFSEGLWKLRHPEQPAWVHPPVAHLTSGPAGLEFNPGIGLPERYDGAFFVCDYKGTSTKSGILSFNLKPDGAGYRMTGSEEFAWGLLPPDFAFGWDGQIYVADWINGWAGDGKRRIVRLYDPGYAESPAAEANARIFRDGFAGRSGEELGNLCGHDDRRVRLFAQYELASRGAESAALFLEMARNTAERRARFHGIWGLWQLGLEAGLAPEFADGLRELLADSDSEIRAQAAKALGEAGGDGAAGELVAALADSSARVRYFAALALGKRKHVPAVPALVRLLRENGDQDVALRHAGVFALAGIGDESAIASLCSGDDSAAVRRAAVLALRRLKSPAMRRFLGDPDPEIAWETARAMHDVPIANGFEALAALMDSPMLADPLTPFPVAHRILNANFRLGQRENARQLAAIAGDGKYSAEIRLEALRSLEKWSDPSPFDRVTWHHRPVPADREREIGDVVKAPVLAAFEMENESADAGILRAAARLIVRYEMAGDGLLEELVLEPSLDMETRLEFFRKRCAHQDANLEAFCSRLLDDASPELRIEAAGHLAGEGNDAARNVLERYWEDGSVSEKTLVLEEFTRLQRPFARNLVAAAVEEQLAAGSPGPLALDLFEAAGAFEDPALRRLSARWRRALDESPDLLGRHQLALAGGSEPRGKRIFETHAAQCIRCHQVNKYGGDAGPDLSKAGKAIDRREIVIALTIPSARIAPGFGLFLFELADGEPVAGYLRDENAVRVQLETMEGEVLEIEKHRITSRSDPVSTMPPMGEVLSLSEMRDLAAYLSSLK